MKSEQIGAADPPMTTGTREGDFTTVENAHQILPRNSEESCRFIARQLLVPGQHFHCRAIGYDPCRPLKQPQHRGGKRHDPTIFPAQFEPIPRIAVAEQGDELSGDAPVGDRHARVRGVLIATNGHSVNLVDKRYKCNLTGCWDCATLGWERWGEIFRRANGQPERSEQ